MIISVYAIPGKKFNEPLPSILNRHSPDFVVSQIKSVVLEYFGLSADQLFVRCRERDLVIPRQVMHYLVKKYTSLSLKKIGAAIPHKKNYDHTTVMYSIKTIMDLLETDENFRNQMDIIEQRLALEPEERNLLRLLKVAKREAPPPAVKPEKTPVIRIETLSEQEKVERKYL
jgi:hypothetical protein